MLFGWDRDDEAAFYDEAFRRHGVPAGGRILEVACGTGQVALRLARLGWTVSGLDRSPEMLAFLAERAAESERAVAPLCADMTSFRLATRQHAVYNPLSSFRILLEEHQARSHLRCVAYALDPGGVYILDLMFGTSGEADDDLEEWTMQRDGVEVSATPERVEVRDGARELVLDWHERLRSYTPEAFEKLVASSGSLSIVTSYPESPGSEEISRFELRPQGELPARGRAMVVLRADG